MPTLKDQLIKLGSTHPHLQEHIRPILDTFTSRASAMWDMAGHAISSRVEKELRRLVDFDIEVNADFLDDDGFVVLQPRDRRSGSPYTSMTEKEVYDAIKKAFETGGFPVSRVVSDSGYSNVRDDYLMSGSFLIRVYPK